MFFFKYHAEKERGRLVPEKALNEVKASGLELRFNIICSLPLGIQ